MVGGGGKNPVIFSIDAVASCNGYQDSLPLAVTAPSGANLIPGWCSRFTNDIAKFLEWDYDSDKFLTGPFKAYEDNPAYSEKNIKEYVKVCGAVYLINARKSKYKTEDYRSHLLYCRFSARFLNSPSSFNNLTKLIVEPSSDIDYQDLPSNWFTTEWSTVSSLCDLSSLEGSICVGDPLSPEDELFGSISAYSCTDEGTIDGASIVWDSDSNFDFELKDIIYTDLHENGIITLFNYIGMTNKEKKEFLDSIPYDQWLRPHYNTKDS